MEQEKKIAEIRKDAQAIAVKVAKLPKITSEKEMMTALELLTQIKARYKRIEEIRLSYTKPLNDSLRKINADFKSALQPLEDLERKVKRAIVDFRAEQEEKRREEERKLQEEARKKAIEEAKKNKVSQKKAVENMVVPTVERQETTLQSKSGMVKARMVTKFKVVDPAKVPDKYWIIDESLIRADVRNGQMMIDGVEIYQEEELSVY